MEYDSNYPTFSLDYRIDSCLPANYNGTDRIRLQFLLSGYTYEWEFIYNASDYTNWTTVELPLRFLEGLPLDFGIEMDIDFSLENNLNETAIYEWVEHNIETDNYIDIDGIQMEWFYLNDYFKFPSYMIEGLTEEEIESMEQENYTTTIYDQYYDRAEEEFEFLSRYTLEIANISIFESDLHTGQMWNLSKEFDPANSNLQNGLHDSSPEFWTMLNGSMVDSFGTCIDSNNMTWAVTEGIVRANFDNSTLDYHFNSTYDAQLNFTNLFNNTMWHYNYTQKFPTNPERGYNFTLYYGYQLPMPNVDAEILPSPYHSVRMGSITNVYENPITPDPRDMTYFGLSPHESATVLIPEYYLPYRGNFEGGLLLANPNSFGIEDFLIQVNITLASSLNKVESFVFNLTSADFSTDLQY
ncbi:MAG: hypothetical protein E4G98_05565, partial [Promethearchaeota archaeon]